MKFSFLNELCESRLFSSKTALAHWDAKKLAELCYLYFLALGILLAQSETHDWASHYCKKTGGPDDFLKWRTTQNDLYVMLHALSVDPDSDSKFDRLSISPGVIRHWLRQAPRKDAEETHKLFMRLDSMFRIAQGSMRSLRRTIMNWTDVDDDDRQDTVQKLVQLIHTRAANSEILPELKKLDRMDESASSGATSAASVATAVGGLGAGFDPDGQWRSVYGAKPKAQLKSGYRKVK